MELVLTYLLGGLMTLSALLVVSVNNPVHSVIALVFVFFNASGLFFIFGLEYLALVLIIVYVGAIAVLFLFVVMMLNIRRIPTFHWASLILILGLTTFSLFSIDFFSLFQEFWRFITASDILVKYTYVDWANNLSRVSDMELIGQLLFTYYYIYVFLAGLILLVAMVGAIALTMVHSRFVKRQVVYNQVARTVLDSVVLRNLK
jgi:NADH-quinone oxidoreductase subunit J